MVVLSQVKKWSAPDLASPALYRLHSVISDFRPPSVGESSEAALRRLLASRAIGGCSLTSDDPAPGSLTLFQSSRVARPLDASKAPYLVSLLSGSARSYLDARVSSVCFVLFLRLLIWTPGGDRPTVTLIQFSQPLRPPGIHQTSRLGLPQCCDQKFKKATVNFLFRDPQYISLPRLASK